MIINIGTSLVEAEFCFSEFRMYVCIYVMLSGFRNKYMLLENTLHITSPTAAESSVYPPSKHRANK